MSWLLGQIGLSLLLAAIAGWFVGWYLRAFRDQDRVEDLRQTMIVTKDVKDRELGELRRQVEDLETRLTRASEPSRPVAVPGGSVSGAPDVSPITTHARAREPRPPVAPHVEVARSPAGAGGAAAAMGELELLTANVAAERERRQEADVALRRKTAAMLTFQAEIEALREAVAEKAAKIAQLQEHVAGTEPVERELESTHGEVAKLEAKVRALNEEHAVVGAAAAAQDAAALESRKEIAIRDTRINDLRHRCATLQAELADARERALEGSATSQVESGLEDARRALQRQIERNRKQEAVHRAVVEQLEGDKARLRADAPSTTTLPHGVEQPASGRGGLPQKRSDELTQISGVGPAFAKAMREAGIDTYAQIAAWQETDIERYALALGAHAKRIRTDRWVEQARELARTSRAQRER